MEETGTYLPVLGYPTDVNLDYYARYRRQDIASAVINRPVKYMER